MTIDQATEQKLGKLRIWNIVVGLILAVQAVLMAVLTNNFSLPVTATFMEGPPGSPATSTHYLEYSNRVGRFHLHGNIGARPIDYRFSLGLSMVQA